jgi:hypothetical protein
VAELKTKKTEASVKEFLDGVADPQQRKDAKAVARLMKEITGARPRMWGPSIVGFGDVHFSYASGREIDWFLTGFSPRRDSLTLYIMSGFSRFDALMDKLGPHRTGKGCLYIKRLDDVHQPTLKTLIKQSVAAVAKAYGAPKSGSSTRSGAVKKTSGTTARKARAKATGSRKAAKRKVVRRRTVKKTS